nr:MAG TPA: hypothetical protein [Caudoviricetes sp.]
MSKSINSSSLLLFSIVSSVLIAPLQHSSNKS